MSLSVLANPYMAASLAYAEVTDKNHCIVLRTRDCSVRNDILYARYLQFGTQDALRRRKRVDAEYCTGWKSNRDGRCRRLRRDKRHAGWWRRMNKIIDIMVPLPEAIL